VKDYPRAQRALDDAHAVAISTSQNAYVCEQFRLQAELLLATGRTDEAEQNFRDALTTARTQGARWLELRAARAYASFQAATRRTDEAIETLRPVVNQITEGRDTPDYVYAETLLETLRDCRNQEPNPEPGTEPGTQAPGTSEPVSF
jgi:predicted Zn-dependent protease